MSVPHLQFVMTAQEHILASLNKLTESPQREEVADASLEDALFAKVMSKKFRKLKADQEAVLSARTVIRNAIARSEPLTFDLLFGGNKLWRFEEAPEVEWAELFAVMYYLRYLKSIASVYPQGARLVLYSQNISVERLNNVPFTETEQYTETFRAMLEWLQPYLPHNTQIVYRQHAETFKAPAEYNTEIEAAKDALFKRNGGKLPTLSPAQKEATELNVRLKPGQDEDPEWREKVELEHQAIFTTKALKQLFSEEGKSLICISPTPFQGVLALGSTKRSIAKFWAGVGALERNEDRYNELVLTPKQLHTAEFEWESVSLQGLKGKNFNRIRVLR